MNEFPKLKQHLDRFAKVITSHNRPYGLHRARDENFFVGKMIASLRKCLQPTFTFTDFPCYVSQSYNVIKTDRVDLLFLTGLLNSRVIRFWLKNKGKMQGENYQIDKEPLLGIPLCVPNAAEQKRIAKLAQRIIDVRSTLGAQSTDAMQVRVQRLAEECDEQLQDAIDHLYGLSASDVATIQASLSRPSAEAREVGPEVVEDDDE